MTFAILKKIIEKHKHPGRCDIIAGLRVGMRCNSHGWCLV